MAEDEIPDGVEGPPFQPDGTVHADGRVSVNLIQVTLPAEVLLSDLTTAAAFGVVGDAQRLTPYEQLRLADMHLLAAAAIINALPLTESGTRAIIRAWADLMVVPYDKESDDSRREKVLAVTGFRCLPIAMQHVKPEVAQRMADLQAKIDAHRLECKCDRCAAMLAAHADDPSLRPRSHHH